MSENYFSDKYDSITHQPEVERLVLRGALKNPDIIADLEVVLKDDDFVTDLNQTVYSVVRKFKSSGEPIEPTIIANYINSLGISFEDVEEDVDLFEYIKGLFFGNVDEDATIKAAQELVFMRVRREDLERLAKAKKYVGSSGGIQFNDYVTEVDRILNETVYAFDSDKTPKRMFDGVEERNEERGKQENKSHAGLKTPFSEYDAYFSGLEDRQIYTIVARPEQGKSTIMAWMGLMTGYINKVPVLFLDTELEHDEVQDRFTAALTGIAYGEGIKLGRWRNDEASTDKMRRFYVDAEEKYKGFYHLHVGNMHIDEICSIVRRWHYKHVGRGNKCLIIYDYLKLTGEKTSYNWGEHQLIGEKTDKLKRIAVELCCPVLTAAQMNRSGVGDVDDTTVVSQSDRILWFASNVYIFRRKSDEELALDGPDRGTHLLKNIKTRIQGPKAFGHRNRFMRPMPPEGEREPVRFYVNFDVDNFSVRECGTVVDCIREAEARFEDSDLNPNDGNGDLQETLL